MRRILDDCEVDSSEISRLISEAQTLIITPVSDGSYQPKQSDRDLPEPGRQTIIICYLFEKD